MKILFIPFSIISGLIAGFLGKKAFEQAWNLIDDEEPPEPSHRRAPLVKILLAALLEGAIFRGVRALTDYEARSAFASLTGSWPGEEEPDPQ